MSVPAPQAASLRGQPVRVVVWLVHLSLPLLGLWLLIGRPATDVAWHHAPSHFWLVLVVAMVNVGLGVVVSEASRRRSDARLFLVSLVFLVSAGFLALHALATPGVLIDHPNGSFDLALPVGLTIAAGFALWSALPVGASAVLRWQAPLRLGIAVLLLAWAVVALIAAGPGDAGVPDRAASPALVIVSVLAVALYLLAAVRYYLLHRRAPAAMLLSVVTAFALLAESMVAVALSANWHLSWWEWHLLLLAAFGFVAYSAHVQYRREGSASGVFDAVTLAETGRRIRAEYGAALEELVGALADRERAGSSRSGVVTARLAERFELTEGQAAVLDRAGVALAAERGLSQRLAALVEVGDLARVGSGEAAFLSSAVRSVRGAFGAVEVGLARDGVVTLGGVRHDVAVVSTVDDGRLLLPLTVKGKPAGLLAVPEPSGPDADRDRALLATLASQLSIALENVRLYAELETLFRSYLSPDVAAALLADPEQAALGGTLVEVTALFADLRGFTAFSERVEPEAIVTMLNAYHGVAVPCVLDNGGTVVQFVGDALLALFNAPARQPDHALRAVRAALDLQASVAVLAADRPDWPRFRVGANTGPALVGNIGSAELRGFNAMGDAVNVAARLQGIAEPGQVVIGQATLAALGGLASCEPLGELTLKGKRDTVAAYLVTGLSAGVP
jgi:adenylate cyclase